MKSTSSTRRHSHATVRYKRSDLAGPMRDVVYIFEREGMRGGAIWWLILDCGHAVARKRHAAKGRTAQIHLLIRSLEEKLAPKRVQCHYCGSGCAKHDPWILIEAYKRGAAAP